MLHKVRTALGRTAGQSIAPEPPVRLRIPEVDREDRIASLLERVEALAGRACRTADPAAYVSEVLAGRTAVASNSPVLEQFGITQLPGVQTGFIDRDRLRAACAAAGAGITSADYALADTGTLVMIASPAEARLISLLPPLHIAVVPQDRILTGLDELFSLLARPAEQTSSMVLITGPSRTADIEQILVRGVHGPGAIHVVVTS
jgi:L-lactate dehydrogenase complex protein LldG